MTTLAVHVNEVIGDKEVILNCGVFVNYVLVQGHAVLERLSFGTCMEHSGIGLKGQKRVFVDVYVMDVKE